MRLAVAALLGFAWGAPADASEGLLRLRGVVVPSVEEALIVIEQVGDAYRRAGRVLRGRFRFKNIRPGTYTVTLDHPELGRAEANCLGHARTC